MKQIAIIFALVVTAYAAPTPHLIVAVSPELPSSIRPEIANRVATLLYEGSAGTRVTVFDAGQMRDLATITLEDISVRLRQKRNLGAIRAVFQNIKTNTGTGFNVPVVLDEIGRQLRPTNAVVLLIGPGLYHNDKESAHDMRRGWPSDGHLSAGRERSVFSTVERAHVLDGLSAHWLITDSDVVMNESHREGIGRFWSLYIGSQGGVLSVFSPNPGTVFTSALNGRRTPFLSADLNMNDKAVVLHTRDIDVPRQSHHLVASTNVVFTTNLVVITNIVRETAPAIVPRVAAGNTGVGIVWKVAPGQSIYIDLDLYVVVPRDGTELSFLRPTSKSGRYFRDIRQSIPSAAGDWKTFWEFVELQGDQLPDEIWVNLFSGSGPVQGELRVQFKGQDHLLRFTVPSVKGNSGIDGGRRDSIAQWVKIDLRTLK